MDTEFMRASSLVWTSRARTRELSPPCSPLLRLLSRASRSFTFHDIPQMGLYIYLFIYLQLTKFTKMNVWVYYLYWSNKYPVGPDDPICRVATMKRNQTEIDEEKFPVVPDENRR